MATKKVRKRPFPQYLKYVPDKEFANIVADFLRKRRGSKPAASIASCCGVPISHVDMLEQGLLRLSLGSIRSILKDGYGCTLEEVLADCFKPFESQLDADGKHPFARPDHYSLHRPNNKKHKTPVLVGGQLKNFVWAVPLRDLQNQPLAVEYLELSPVRKRSDIGVMPKNAHYGTEVIMVIHGSIEVKIDEQRGGTYRQKLEHGDSFHFNSKYSHEVSNIGPNSALLFIVRVANDVIVRQ